jgi:hypothetical protein
MGGYQNRKVIGYQRLEELNARIAPYVLTRRTRDCFDLPPMLDPVTLEARLTPATWAHYVDMRERMVVDLGHAQCTPSHAIVKALRLLQITSGYLGGVQQSAGPAHPASLPFGPPPAFMQAMLPPTWIASGNPAQPPDFNSGVATVELSHEKLDVLLEWLEHHAPDRLLVWCRFTRELERTTTALERLYPRVLNLRGGQSDEDRQEAKRLLAPGATLDRGAVVGNPKAGGASLNLSGAGTAIYLSRGPSLIERTQSIGRIERPGAQSSLQIIDVIAAGPKGQKTIDHHMLKALRAKDDMARWTVNEWRALLREV